MMSALFVAMSLGWRELGRLPRHTQQRLCSPNGTPGGMVLYPNGVTLGLVKNVNLLVVGDEHLLRDKMRGAE